MPGETLVKSGRSRAGNSCFNLFKSATPLSISNIVRHINPNKRENSLFATKRSIINYMFEPFLNESWGDLAKHEEGHDFDEIYTKEEEKALNVYQEIKKLRNHDETSKALVKDLEDSVIRYVGAVDKLSSSRIRKEDPKETENADRARRSAHEALISNLNILSRYCVKNGLDTNWRNVVGSHRNQVRDWALNVSTRIIKERIGGD